MQNRFFDDLQCAMEMTYYDRRRQLRQLLAEESPDSEQTLQLVLILIRDHDGFVREAATQWLARSSSPAALQAIVQRLNDWVPVVRQRALASAQIFLQTERLSAVLASLEIIVRLTRKSRVDHSGFISRVGEFLDRPENRRMVLAYYPKSRGAAACFLLSRLLCWSGQYQGEIIRLSTQHRDFLVRSRFLSACEASGAVAEEALRILFADHHPRNRQKAFLALWRGDLPVADRQALLACALLDSSGAVRSVALWAARQSAFDLATFVLAFGKGEALLPRAYLGWLNLLGVLARSDSLPLIQKAFADVRPQVRQAALLAWVGISRDTADVPTAQAMVDASPKVAKLAGQLLRKGRVLLSGKQLEWIDETLDKRGDLGRLLAFSVRLPYWERLLRLLELLPRYPDEPERQQIIRETAGCLLKQRYAFVGQPADMQERLRRGVRESGLKEIWCANERLLASLKQFD